MKTTLIICKPKLPEHFHVQRQWLTSQIGVGTDTEVINLPLFDLVPHAQQMEALAQWAKTQSAREHKVMVFVSPSVLEMAMQCMQQWPADLYCGVMGQQSARLAQTLGVPLARILAPSGKGPDEPEDSEGLAHVMLRHFHAGQCEVLLCKGPRGRTAFVQTLEAQQHAVSIIECYDRQEIQLDAAVCQRVLNSPERLVVWLTSSEAAQALSQQLERFSEEGARTFKRRVIVLTTHPRIRAKCQELGYAHLVEISTGIQSVNSWLKESDTQMSQLPENTAASQWLPKAAFFISLACCVLIVLIAFAGKNQIEKTRLAFGERIQKDSITLELLKEQLGESSDLTKDLKTRFELLEQAQKEESSQRQSLQEVYNNLLASRAEVSLSEVEQLVSIAKRQLYLLGNLHGAAIALEQAIDVLGKADKPAMMNLRSALQADLSAIKALPTSDLFALAMGLDEVINFLDSLPMLSGVQADSEGEETQPTPMDEQAQSQIKASSEGSWFSRIWGNVRVFSRMAWQDLKSLVEITEVDTPELLLLSSRQEADVRNALRLSLLNARMTLLSRQSELLKSDLERSQKLLSTYFDQKNPHYERAHTLLQDMGKVHLDLVLPELKATTSALRLAQASQQGDTR